MSDLREKYYYTYGNETFTTSDSLIYCLEKKIDILITSNKIQKYVVKGFVSSTAQYLSLYFYGTPDYWWIILTLNGIDDPTHIFPKDSVVYHPSQELISEYKKSLFNYNKSNISSGNFVSGTFTF